MAPICIFVVSATLHASTLWGSFVWDDRPAVLDNRDVRTDTSWRDMWINDFWGQAMDDPNSHKSYRPLTTLTYRFGGTAVDRLATHSTAKASAAKDTALTPAPDPRFGMGYHLVNVLVHSLTCVGTLLLSRRVFSGQELPALMSSLLFTTHPVHVEAVAPLVGRADLLCGFFSVASLLLFIPGTRDPGPSHIENGYANSHRSISAMWGSLGRVTKEGGKGDRVREDHRSHHNAYAVSPRVPWALVRAPGVSFLPQVPGAPRSDNQRYGAGLAPGPTRFVAALLAAVASTLCKEVGVTAFGLMVAGEVMGFLRESAWTLPVDGAGECNVYPNAENIPGFREALYRHWMRFGMAPVARALSACACSCLLLWWHFWLHRGQGVRPWGVLENDVAVMDSLLDRTLSYGFTHAVYAGKVLWPATLSYDWGFRCIPTVTSFFSLANLATLALYVGISATLVLGFLLHHLPILWGVCLTVIPFLPASNAIVTIGAVVAERLLYLPSLGVCLLAGCLLYNNNSNAGVRLSRAAEAPSSSADPSASGREAPGPQDVATEQGVSHRLSIDQKPDREAECERETAEAGGDSSPSPQATLSNETGEGIPGSPVRAQEQATGGESLFRREQNGGDYAYLHQNPAEKGQPLEKGESTGGGSFNSGRGAMTLGLLAWSVRFGARSVYRCQDWGSERRLFESALEVCPDGIKTLNNLAVRMLNKEEASQAAELLGRAVEV
ncbi:unnamed protein product, partial [Discosporangium mesarthrocarpum]